MWIVALVVLALAALFGVYGIAVAFAFNIWLGVGIVTIISFAHLLTKKAREPDKRIKSVNGLGILIRKAEDAKKESDKVGKLANEKLSSVNSLERSIRDLQSTNWEQWIRNKVQDAKMMLENAKNRLNEANESSVEQKKRELNYAEQELRRLEEDKKQAIDREANHSGYDKYDRSSGNARRHGEEKAEKIYGSSIREAHAKIRKLRNDLQIINGEYAFIRNLKAQERQADENARNAEQNARDEADRNKSDIKYKEKLLSGMIQEYEQIRRTANEAKRTLESANSDVRKLNEFAQNTANRKNTLGLLIQIVIYTFFIFILLNSTLNSWAIDIAYYQSWEPDIIALVLFSVITLFVVIFDSIRFFKRSGLWIIFGMMLAQTSYAINIYTHETAPESLIGVILMYILFSLPAVIFRAIMLKVQKK